MKMTNALIEKVQEKMPKQYEQVLQSFVKSSVNKKQHYNFVEKAFTDAKNKKQDTKDLSAVSLL
ncbi:MAG: hypothetical protein ACRC4W_02450, partial [Treponemataceae bacterium]